MVEKQIINRIQNAINYIEDNLYERIELGNVARAAFMSQSSFYTLFSNVFGTTLKDYIRKRRLSLSSHDLIHCGSSILEIALKYQFSTYESYSRAFKNLFGISPNNYRVKGIYIDAFPRAALKSYIVSEGELVITMEMNKETIINELHNTPSGCILDIDIDNFESINVNYGYDIGDKVLVEVPERIKYVIRDHNLDIDVTRISNDEFVLILKDKSKAFIESLSQEIINAMHHQFIFGDVSLMLTVSIGISSFTLDDNCDNSEVINSAKNAMMLAKKNGKNQYSSTI